MRIAKKVPAQPSECFRTANGVGQRILARPDGKIGALQLQCQRAPCKLTLSHSATQSFRHCLQPLFEHVKVCGSRREGLLSPY